MQVACPQCGQTHDLDAMELAYRHPDAYLALPPEARESAGNFGSDGGILCPPDAPETLRYFIRGVLELPVEGREQAFGIGLWAEIEGPDYKRVQDYCKGSDDGLGISGRLATALAGYEPGTSDLPVRVKLFDPAMRPIFTLSEPGHVLWQEQQSGITPERALAFLQPYLH